VNGRREFSLAYLSVVGTSPHEMIEVAATTGYDYVGLRLTKVTTDEELPPLLTDTSLVRRTRRHADDAGVGILDVELARVGPHDDARDYARLMERAGELGARFALAQIPDHDRKRATYSFATLCELAAPYGVVVGLEFLPWGPTDDLAAAVDIVRGANQDNGGIVVDTLHFCRSASTADQVRVLPSSMFPYVQLCDAPRYTPFTDDGLIHTAREARYFPGDAGLELRPLVQALPHVPYALEIPNERMRADLGTEEFVRRALDASRRFLTYSDGIPELLS
jgi:sugar phosphate isomerase/epimerase